MSNKNYNQSIKIVNKIQKIRSKNNKNWMDLLRLSLRLDYKATSNILSQIYRDDKKITALIKKLKVPRKKSK